MSKFTRIRNVLTGILTIAVSVLLATTPEFGYPVITLLLSLSLLFYGLRSVVYYFSMARHMVGGRQSLYRGILFSDLGIFTLTLTNVPHVYILLYLLAIHAFSGAVAIMGALEARRYEAQHWRLKLINGIVNILLALSCLIFIRSMRVAVYVYCIGLCYSACMRIISAFRKNAIVYIQ